MKAVSVSSMQTIWGGELAAVEDGAELRRAAGRVGVQPRQVDGNRRAGEAAVQPLALRAAHVLEHIQIQREQQPALFKQFDEIVGRRKGAVVMLPAHQRLGADDSHAIRREPGLIIGRELLFREPGLHVAEQAGVQRLPLVLGAVVQRV